MGDEPIQGSPGRRGHGLPGRRGRGWGRAVVAASLALIHPGDIGDAWAVSRAANVGFWIGTNHSSVFDDQTLRMVADHGRLIVLNAPAVGPGPEHTFGAVVSRLHGFQPRVPVLLYGWVTRWVESQRIGSVILSGYADLGSLLLRDPRGQPLRGAGGRALFGDLRQEAYRAWVHERIVAAVRETGSDGVALDVSLRTPDTKFAAVCDRDPNACGEYARGADAAFRALSEAIRPKMLLYNGLWNVRPGMLEDQERLLRHSDAAAIEYFGLDPERGATGFRDAVEVYLDVIRRNPSKVFMVFGRGPNGYVDYAEDYLWQRYLYAAYLLAASGKTTFKYHASFQVPPDRTRTGGIDVYGDWQVDLGEPLADATRRGPLLLREFTRGMVVVAPHDGGRAQVTIPEGMFTPEGERVSGTAEIAPGRGILLVRDRPRAPRALRIDLRRHVSGWRWASLERDGDGRAFARLARAARGHEWEHDFMLEWSRTLVPRHTARLRVRTRDAGAALLFRVEVDDSRRAVMHAVVKVPVGPTPESTTGPRIEYRVPTRGHSAYLRSPMALSPDGDWQAIHLDGPRVVDEAGGLKFRRWESLRVVGDVDVSEIELW
jgi:hypothetical protein